MARKGSPWLLGAAVALVAVAAMERSATLVAAQQPVLYVGGGFTRAMGVDASYIAQWNGTAWAPVGAGFDNWVIVMALFQGELVAGGDFVQAGSTVVNHIARWTGAAWTPFGVGADAAVWALAANGSQLYAGGEFLAIGGQTANRVAVWDGSAWSALGTGMDDYVAGLAMYHNRLFAAGWFTAAGAAVAANHIAAWDGAEWSPLGSGTDNNIFALHVAHGFLYAGGWFTEVDGIAAGRIARWNGTAWSTIGQFGAGFDVYGISSHGADVYIVGEFSFVDDVPANRTACWNGTHWAPLGMGLDGRAETILAVEDGLFVGGQFAQAGGVTVNSLARWNGVAWFSFGSGMNDAVNAMVATGVAFPPPPTTAPAPTTGPSPTSPGPGSDGPTDGSTFNAAAVAVPVVLVLLIVVLVLAGLLWRARRSQRGRAGSATHSGPVAPAGAKHKRAQPAAASTDSLAATLELQPVRGTAPDNQGALADGASEPEDALQAEGGDAMAGPTFFAVEADAAAFGSAMDGQEAGDGVTLLYDPNDFPDGLPEEMLAQAQLATGTMDGGAWSYQYFDANTPLPDDPNLLGSLEVDADTAEVADSAQQPAGGDGSDRGSSV